MANRKQNRIIKSFTLERAVSDYIARTRAGQSASERTNELLRRAIALEQEEQLAAEAQTFFRQAPREEREESNALQAAAKRTLARDED